MTFVSCVVFVPASQYYCCREQADGEYVDQVLSLQVGAAVAYPFEAAERYRTHLSRIHLPLTRKVVPSRKY